MGGRWIVLLCLLAAALQHAHLDLHAPEDALEQEADA